MWEVMRELVVCCAVGHGRARERLCCCEVGRTQVERILHVDP